MSRLPYSGLAPPGFDSTNRSQIEQNDFTARTADCMLVYQHTLLIHFVGAFFQDAMLTHPVNTLATPCQHI